MRCAEKTKPYFKSLYWAKYGRWAWGFMSTICEGIFLVVTVIFQNSIMAMIAQIY